MKAIFSQAHKPHDAIRAVVGISPPRFSHSRLMTHRLCDHFRADFARAGELVAHGQPDQLMNVKQPLPFVVTAAGFIEKYGPHDRYDFLPLLSRLTCPTLILLGTETLKTSPAFDGLAVAVASEAGGNPNLAWETIEGANINYASCEELPFARAASWLKSI